MTQLSSWLSLVLIGSTTFAQIACASSTKSSAATSRPGSEAGTQSDTDAEMMPTEVLIAERASIKKKKGGGSSSIGTDSFDVRTQTSWFYGTRPIVTCFQHVNSFGVDENEVLKTLERSVSTWKKYFTQKRITTPNDDTAPSANFKLTGKCKGDEDLVIHFGTGPIFGGLTDLKAVQKLNYPAAYVNKSHMSRDMKWSKGYVRIVSHGYYGKENARPFPDWQKQGTLEAILTHEIGHILGFVHTPGTIMSTDLVETSLSDKSKTTSVAIDGTHELVTCGDCPRSFVTTTNPSQTTLFEKLGLNAKNSIELARSKESWTLSDGTKSRVVKQTSLTTLASNRSLLTNFDTPANSTSDTVTVYGYLEVEAKSEKIPLVLELNSGTPEAALVLRASIDGEIREIGRFRER